MELSPRSICAGQLAGAGLDRYFVVFDVRFVCLDGNHARRGHDFAGADVERTVVEIAFDDVAVDIALGQGTRAMGAGVVGHVELAVDVEDRQRQLALFDLDGAAGFDFVSLAQSHAR
jgi:hypothetical protein